MNVASLLRRYDGATRTSVLLERGVSKYELAQLVEAGTLLRPTRGWIALPSLDSDATRAVRNNAVISCVTQAKRLGLWVFRADELHLAARARSSGAVDPHAKMHHASPVLTRNPARYVDPLENVLGYVATCLPYGEAQAVWESALNQGLVRLDQLRRLPYRGAARQLLYECTPYSDSGLETFVKQNMRRVNVMVRPQAVILGRPVDFLIGERLVLQIDGGHHVGRQRRSDIAHDAELILAGYTVIRVDYVQVTEHWPEVQHRLLLAMAQGLHLA